MKRDIKISIYHPVRYGLVRHIREPPKYDVDEVPGRRLGRQVRDEVEVEGEVGADGSLLVAVVQHRHADIGVAFGEENPEEAMMLT